MYGLDCPYNPHLTKGDFGMILGMISPVHGCGGLPSFCERPRVCAERLAQCLAACFYITPVCMCIVFRHFLIKVSEYLLCRDEWDMLFGE